MQFNTYIFILLFLPSLVAGYYGLCKFSALAAKLFLVGMSFVFYGYAGIPELQWLLVSIGLNYLVILGLKKLSGGKKFLLFLGVVFNIALLFYFKYFNFAIENVNRFLGTTISAKDILLPLGVSFFTFQQIGYLVDTYRGETETHTLLDYVLYVVYLPKLLMGPIVPQNVLIPQFHDERKRKLDSVAMMVGIRMFNIGLFKKIVMADTFAKAVTWGFGNVDVLSSMDVFLVMLAYTFQIYFDFSGYSDMALGVSRMLNIELPKNFDSPYKAFTIREFWKKWHISLTKFFTKYVYIPLGGNKHGEFRTYLNTMIVFVVSGLWHGANWTFMLWGLLHGGLSVLERMLKNFVEHIHPAMKWVITFLVVNVLWLLFRADSIDQWMWMLRRMLLMQSTLASDGLLMSFIQPEVNFLLWLTNAELINQKIRGFSAAVYYVGALLLCMGFPNASEKKYKHTVISAVVSALILVFTLTCIGSEAVFVYNNF